MAEESSVGMAENTFFSIHHLHEEETVARRWHRCIKRAHDTSIISTRLIV